MTTLYCTRCNRPGRSEGSSGDRCAALLDATFKGLLAEQTPRQERCRGVLRPATRRGRTIFFEGDTR